MAVAVTALLLGGGRRGWVVNGDERGEIDAKAPDLSGLVPDLGGDDGSVDPEGLRACGMGIGVAADSATVDAARLEPGGAK